MASATPQAASDGLWILSQPRVGSMLLSDFMNSVFGLGPSGIQEYFYHEPMVMRDLSVTENPSSIRLGKEVFWFAGLAPDLRSRFRPLVTTLMHGDAAAVQAIRESDIFHAYKAALAGHIATRGLPAWAKVHRRHFQLFFDDAEMVEHIISGRAPRRYLVLGRDDLARQAVSLYITHQTGRVTLTADQEEAWCETSLTYDEEALLRIHDRLAVGRDSSWESLLPHLGAAGAQTRHVEYGDLIADPVGTAANLLRELFGFEPPKRDLQQLYAALSLRPMTRPESESFVQQLRAALSARASTQIPETNLA